MDLSIIIVSWNVKEKLKENLKAIYESQGNFSFEVFVIDNNSHDNSAEMVEKKFPEVKLIKNKENVGLSRAVNQVKDLISGDFVLLLNSDNKVQPNTFINMLDWMRANPNAGVATCKLIDQNGETIKQIRRFPTLKDQLAIVLKLTHIFPNILKDYIREDFDYEKPAKVDSVRGAFFMIRKNLIKKIGLWDPRYFIWFEEVDYCRETCEAGSEVWYTPVAECVDYIGQSFNQVDMGTKQKYFSDSMLKYFKKWHPVWQYWVLKLVWPIIIFFAMILGKIGIKSRGKN